MTVLIIKGQTSDGEKVEEMFQIPDPVNGIPDWKRALYRYACAVLWDARWTPGSLSWQVFTTQNIALPVGENYENRDWIESG